MRLTTKIAVGLLLMTTGCAGLVQDLRTQQSQGLTGCTQEEMKFKDLSAPGFVPGSGPWSIECRGKTFLCSRNGESSAACHER